MLNGKIPSMDKILLERKPERLYYCPSDFRAITREQ